MKKTALAIFVPNLAGIHEPVLKLYQTAIHPALSPVLGQFLWLVRMERNSRGSGFTTWQTGQAGGRGDAMSVAWLGSGPSPHKGISPVLTILLCSLKLHYIWVMLLI